MTLPPERSPAIVLSVSDHGESDKIVTCYCPTFGKLTGIAKGAKRSKKRFVNKLEIFSLLEIHFTAGNRTSMVRIDQADLLASFPNLRAHYDRYSNASLLCELLLHWTKENDGDENIFKLLAWALESLDQGDQLTRTIILFQIKLFDLLGYRPHLAGCIDCGRHDNGGAPYRFSSSRGGLVCNLCNRDTVAAHIPLSLSTAKLLHKAQTMPREKITRLQFSRHSTNEAMALMRRYNSDLLQREIFSWRAIP
ncbi:MAG: DNA repair protein RecO [Desulfobulbaceae bacterium]|nr:DNA repair protein RecO [Desulfobulbaceae bacterium]